MDPGAALAISAYPCCQRPAALFASRAFPLGAIILAGQQAGARGIAVHPTARPRLRPALFFSRGRLIFDLRLNRRQQISD
jgi:hypothetical protein